MSGSSFFAVAFWFMLLPALWASGSFFGVRCLREKNPRFSGILVLGGGLGIYAYFMVLAGSFGWLKPETVLCFLVLCLFFGWRSGMGVFRWAKDVLRSFWGVSGIFSRICQLTMALTFAFTALFCFLPEIANDALAIQLYAAKLFAQNASFAPSFFHIDSYRPLLMSVIYTTGLLFHNVAIAKFFHWFCGVLLVGALMTRIAETTGNKKASLFFGLMLWLTPTLVNQVTAACIDAGTSLFIFLGYCILTDAFEDLDPAHFFYGGIMVGLAVAIRSLSLSACFAVLFMLVVRFFKDDVKTRVMRAGGSFLAGVFLASAYWFLRDWIYTGNPVYPFLGSWFGTEDRSLFSTIYFYGMGLPRSVASFLMIPWDITFRPKYFDYHHWVGPFYFCVFPFVVYAAVKIKKARWHLLFMLLLTTFWYFTGQNVRYLLPVLPVYLMTAAMGMGALRNGFLCSRRGSFLARVVGCFFVVAMLGLTVYHFRYQFLGVSGVWNSDEYLKKMERTIPIAKWINQNLARNAKVLLWEEVHLFYFDRDMVLEGYSLVRQRYPDPISLFEGAAILKRRGITHLLYASDPEIAGLPFHPLRLPFMEAIRLDPHLSKEVFTCRSSNVVGDQKVYRLCELT